MNERIKELAEKARQWVNNPDNVDPSVEYVFYKNAYDRKFAELIIHGCIDAVISVPLPNEYEQRCAESIRKYFGIK